MSLILAVVIGNIVYQLLVIGLVTAISYRRVRKAKELQAKYKKELEAQGIQILETAEQVENYMKKLTGNHLQVVKDEKKDPRNNN
jgi:hypothetical protein